MHRMCVYICHHDHKKKHDIDEPPFKDPNRYTILTPSHEKLI